MRFLPILAVAGCISLLSTPSDAQSNWPADDIMNPDGFLPIAASGDTEHLTGVASDGYYGVIIAWQNDDTGRVYAKRLDPVAASFWAGTFADFRVSVFDVETEGNTQTQAAVTDDSLRGGYIAWTDTRDGVGPPNGVIYLQHIDKIGNRGDLFNRMDVLASENATILMGKLDFTLASGAVTGTNTAFSREVFPGDIIKPENSANWYTVQSVGPGDTDLTVSPVVVAGDEGTDLYATVVPYLTTSFSECHTPKVLANNEGCFVTYLNDTLALPKFGGDTTLDGRKVPLLQMTYVSSEGERLWTTDIDFPHPDAEYELHDDGEEGVLVVWHVPPYVDANLNLEEPSASFAVRIAPDGEGVWGEDPVPLFSRKATTAEVSYDPNRRELWVSGPWKFKDEEKPTAADDGNFAVVNKLLSTGSWAWGTWSRPFRWDSREKGVSNPLTVPRYDDSSTWQDPVGLAGDGIGGVYVLVKDSRRTFYSAGNIDALTGVISFIQGSNTVTGAADFLTEISLGFLTLEDFEFEYEQFVRVDTAGVPGGMAWYKVTKVIDSGTLEIESPYIGPDVSGMGEVASTYGRYDDPYQNIYAHHVSPTGSINWKDGEYTIKWNDDKAFKYATLSSTGDKNWYNYPWIEGLTAARNPVGSVKDHVHCVCEPWITYNPVPGDRRAPEVSIIWVEDYKCEYPGAESVDYDAIRCTQMDLVGEVLDWTCSKPWRTKVLEVYNGLNDATPGEFRMEVVSDERYGMTIVWEQIKPAGADSDVYAKHVNYHRMDSDGRAPPIGWGPDIFPPDPVTDFSAADGIGHVTLTWTNPAGGPKPLDDFAGVRIRRSTTSYPGTEEQGDWVYQGSLEEFVDELVEPGLTYYYSAFAFDTELSIRNFSGPVKVDVTLDFGDVGNFQAYGSDDGVLPKVDLSWENPGGTQYVGVRILRSTDDFPPLYNSHLTDPATVDLVGDFDDPAVDYTDLGLMPGDVYYYTAFAYKGADPRTFDDYAYGVTAFAVPLQGVTIQLPVGTDDGQVTLDLVMPTTEVSNFVEVIVRRSETDYPVTELDGVALDPIVAQDPVTAGDTTIMYPFDDKTVVNDTEYYYSVFAHYILPAPIGSVYTAPAQVTAIPGDRDPPSEVTNFSVTSDEDKVVPISWDNPSGGTDEWSTVEIRRSTDAATVSNGTVVYTQVNDGTVSSTHLDTNVLNGTTYYYAAIAIDDVGNESSFTALSATPIDTTPPDMPSLTAQPDILTPLGEDQKPVVVVTWSINDLVAPNLDLAGESPVVVLRANWDAGESPPPGDWYPTSPGEREGDVTGKHIATVNTGGQPDGTVNEDKDDGLKVGVTYYYAAWAIDDESPPNVSSRATAVATPVDNFPPAISGVTVTVSGPVSPVPTGAEPWQTYQALVEWSVQDLEATRYEITCGTTTGYHLEPKVADATLSSETDREDTITHLWGGTTFYYKLTMWDSKDASSSYTGSFPTTLTAAEDDDSDGLHNAWETTYGLDPSEPDSDTDGTNDDAEDDDGDTLTNLQEYRYGTDPTKADTDGDGQDDPTEIANRTDPLNAPPGPMTFEEGCGAVPGRAPPAAPPAVMLLALAAALRALRRRPEGCAE